MRSQQLDDAHRDALDELVAAACARAAENLSRFVGVDASYDAACVAVNSLEFSREYLTHVHTRATIIAEQITGDIEGTLLLIVPPVLDSGITRALGVDPRDRDMRTSALAELGNIVLGGFVNEVSNRTGLDISPGPPQLTAGPENALQRAIAAAGSNDDAVVSFSAILQVDQASLGMGQTEIMFAPTPGALQRVVNALDVSGAGHERQIPVNMGELAVSTGAGVALVARGLGSCIGLAIIDHIAGVGALAHVMLPAAPERRTLGGKPTYAARYADTAVRSALDAVEHAGGARHRARAYIAGGSQMFTELGQGTGIEFDRLRISERNVEAVLNALVNARVSLEGSDVGGSAGRMLELRLDPIEVVCTVPSEGRVVDLVRDRAS